MSGGAGVKVFQPGEVLTASHVNGYLMDQVIARFPTIAARDAAFSGPSSSELAEGRFVYIDDVNEVQYYDGAEWQSASQFAFPDGSVDSDKLVNGSVTAVKVANLSIANADINTSALISLSKIASHTPGSIVIHSSAGVATATVVSGNVSVAPNGISSISSGVITNALVSGSAAIEQQKFKNIALSIKTSGYTLRLIDANSIVEMNSTSSAVVTVPPNSEAAFPVGSQVAISRYGTGSVQVAAGAGVTILSTPGNFLRAQYSFATLLKRSTNEWYLLGDLRAS
jgi:hypothetical protein